MDRLHARADGRACRFVRDGRTVRMHRGVAAVCLLSAWFPNVSLFFLAGLSPQRQTYMEKGHNTVN